MWLAIQVPAIQVEVEVRDDVADEGQAIIDIDDSDLPNNTGDIVDRGVILPNQPDPGKGILIHTTTNLLTERPMFCRQYFLQYEN